MTVHKRLHPRWVFGNRSKPRITLQSPPKTIVEMDEPQLTEALEGWIQASRTKSSTAKLKGGGGQREKQGWGWKPGQKDSGGLSPIGSP